MSVVSKCVCRGANASKRWEGRVDRKEEWGEKEKKEEKERKGKGERGGKKRGGESPGRSPECCLWHTQVFGLHFTPEPCLDWVPSTYHQWQEPCTQGMYLVPWIPHISSEVLDTELELSICFCNTDTVKRYRGETESPEGRVFILLCSLVAWIPGKTLSLCVLFSYLKTKDCLTRA